MTAPHVEARASSPGLVGALEVAAEDAAREADRAYGVERTRLRKLANVLRAEARGLQSMKGRAYA